MKKITLFAAAALSVASATAAVTTPVYFSENFVEMGKDSEFLSPDWTTYGNGAKPTQLMQNFFNASGEGPYYILLAAGEQTFAISCTDFDPKTPADQWLVTPEIEVPVDDASLQFTVFSYHNRGQWGSGDVPYKVLVSTTGVEKSDFEETPVYEANARIQPAEEFSTRAVICPLSGYKGKKIHLAFVNNGENAGPLGFSNITLSNYAVNLTNLTPQLTQKGGLGEIVEINIGMRAPVECQGLTAVLDVNGESHEVKIDKKFGGNGSTLLYTKIAFDEYPIVVESEEGVSYTVTITPDFEGAEPSVVTGFIGVPTTSYVQNVVMEEVTATGCQACPAGMAAIEYYHDTYPGTETEGKVIPIGIHGAINWVDPMRAGVEEYLSMTMSVNGSTVYPQAMFNRISRGLTPEKKEYVERLISQKSNNKVAILGTSAPETVKVGDEVTVTFDTYNSFIAKDLELRAAVVLLEDNVKGSNATYSQENGFYNRNSQYIAQNYGNFLVPYMEKYVLGGELCYQLIPFDKMTYSHVARGIYPSYRGDVIQSEWLSDEAQRNSITFNVPETIMKWENTQVVVLIMNADNEIVASDIRSTSERFSSVSEIAGEASDVVINAEGGKINVAAAGNADVRIFTVAGQAVAADSFNGSYSFDASGLSGVVIVRVETAAGVKVAKLML